MLITTLIIYMDKITQFLIRIAEEISPPKNKEKGFHLSPDSIK